MWWRVAAVAVAASLLPGAHPRTADMRAVVGARSTSQDVARADAAAPDAASAMRVYRDPATGAFGEPPPNLVLPPAIRSLGSDAQALVETQSPTAGGGVMVDLRGRFDAAITATVDDGGRVGTRCRSAADAPP
jgi:hypothetical protein